MPPWLIALYGLRLIFRIKERDGGHWILLTRGCTPSPCFPFLRYNEGAIASARRPNAGTGPGWRGLLDGKDPAGRFFGFFGPERTEGPSYFFSLISNNSAASARKR